MSKIKKNKSKFNLQIPKENKKLIQLLISMEALDLLPSARIIALIIYCFSQNETESKKWTTVSVQKISEYSGVNRRHVFKLLSMLENYGIIVSFKQPGNETKRKINYSFNEKIASSVYTRRNYKGCSTEHQHSALIGDSFLITNLNLIKKELIKEETFNNIGTKNCISLGKKDLEFAAFDLVDEFRSRWSKKYNSNYHFTGRDRTKAYGLIKTLGIKECLIRLNKYLENDNEWVKKRGHSFTIFCSTINQYGSLENEAKISQHKDFEREIRKSEQRIARRKKSRDEMAKRNRKQGSE